MPGRSRRLGRGIVGGAARNSEAVGFGTSVSGTRMGAVSKAPQQGANLLSGERPIGLKPRKDLETANPDTTDPNATVYQWAENRVFLVAISDVIQPFG